ncbi:uncharacterized protein LOC130987217 isoform X2 [Salvia miltiorrhiza]|uniref:uncharacterized protein LOC130987217 isoform X2 n=1 Tax=Salvia miltiorrhiza TaxID=226208 RepID=UPI0025ACE04E|nr:uncharacterized protein LOC130987217 isoform X2 [Salvia miltiorrhiza]
MKSRGNEICSDLPPHSTNFFVLPPAAIRFAAPATVEIDTVRRLAMVFWVHPSALESENEKLFVIAKYGLSSKDIIQNDHCRHRAQSPLKTAEIERQRCSGDRLSLTFSGIASIMLLYVVLLCSA